MKILVVNAGSSSLKYQLIDMNDESVIAKGGVERIGIPGGKLTHKYDGKQFVLEQEMPNHTVAINAVLDALLDSEHGVIKSITEIGAVGHRVLHGGSKFTASCKVDETVKQAIRDCIPLGPLHNPANLMGIEACEKVMPGVPQVTVFDTAFHQTMPEQAFLYGVPYEYYTKYSVRRYGFHGTSHRYVSARARQLLGEENTHKVIVCHLGNGSSLSAVVDGKCVDTSMGLTPLEGVLMGTRSGSIDPAVVEFIANKEGWNTTRTLTCLNKQSGLQGITGVSSDMRDVWSIADGKMEGHQTEEEIERAKIALDVWAYGIRKYIGSYAAAMGGVDAVIFTAGIGENDGRGRAKVCEGLEFLGIKIDEEVNAGTRGVEKKISAADSKVQVWVIPTNEELAIARDTLDLVTK